MPGEGTHMGADMDLDDIGGAAWGGLGGLVRWFHDAHHKETVAQVVTGIVGSVATAVGFGHLTQVLVAWHYPDVPKTVSAALGFVSGLCSSILVQLVTGLASELANRLKGRLLDRIAPHGPDSPAAGGPVPGPPPAVVVVGGLPAGPVLGERRGEQLPAAAPNGTAPRAERPDAAAGG